jgi:hypothetical protein
LVIAAFCEWADASGRPARDGKAIEGKYKMVCALQSHFHFISDGQQLLKTKKPTSDALPSRNQTRPPDRKPDQRES